MKRKKSIAGRLGMTAFALTLVTTCISSGTLAKYASEVTGKGTAVAAKWDVEFKADANATTAATTQSSDPFTFTLEDTRTENGSQALVAENTIAPGSTGYVALQINVKSTNEVKTGGSFEINATNLNGLPIKFYKDSSFNNEIELDASTHKGTVTSTTTVAPNETSDKTIDQVIYWRWDTSSTDTADTTIGKKDDNGRKGTFTIKMIAEQITTTGASS